MESSTSTKFKFIRILSCHQQIRESQRSSIPHHMLGIINYPDYEFNVTYFCKHMLEIKWGWHLAGIVDEKREIFVFEVNCIRGIERAIGVHELDYYFEIEKEKYVDKVQKENIVNEFIRKPKITLTNWLKINSLRSTR
ncbi:hypothetical protein MTR_7g024220 [Medicago truncatula]|uniref:Uncharacterized protein n=1 Tax=Medicago truncatula TaxID=3880 RepID=G7KWT2_MEDTR|nr:hypothetical protein MTR_7g024220 [Medicago truncatula]